MVDVPDRGFSADKICRHFDRRHTVRRGIDRSAMRAHKMGRNWKFKRDQVETGGAACDAREEARKGEAK